nr:DNA helicase Pif1-like protein [Tanacetum cinerariifolium]
MLGHIGFECLIEINEQIIHHVILEFYSQYRVNYTLEGQMLINFVVQDQLFSYTLEEFGQILGIPLNGLCHISSYRSTRAKDSKGLWHEKRSFLHFFFIHFGQPSSSHLNDDDNDGNDEWTSRVSTLSPTRFVNSLSNDIPQIFSNPPNVDPNIEAFYSRQTEILNRQVQLRDEQYGGIRSIEKGIKNLWRKKKK